MVRAAWFALAVIAFVGVAFGTEHVLSGYYSPRIVQPVARGLGLVAAIFIDVPSLQKYHAGRYGTLAIRLGLFMLAFTVLRIALNW